MNGFRATVVAAMFFALGIAQLWTTPALAQRARAHAGEVVVILAKEQAGEIDASLEDIAALQRAPFNAFQSMEVLSKPAIRLRTGNPQIVSLPNGRRLQIELQQVLPDNRYRVRVSINRPEERDYLPLLTVVAAPGDPFFVAGQSHDGGTLIVGVRVGQRPD